ncbi:hypothetical protein Syun_001785 [Stephania yunnanensis]|uniref:Uncharacterized protein n=1 Tax=Stephania yunnanensis TaxID=152371 RepID=A0AAP0Q6T1_9MAGN
MAETYQDIAAVQFRDLYLDFTFAWRRDVCEGVAERIKEMQKFTAKIVDMMKQEKLYASQGGPIILSQEEGWPLGLQPLNMRVGLVRTRDFSGSISFNTLITRSPSSSTDSSSDLDTEIEEGADEVWSIVGGKVGDLFVNLFHRLQLSEGTAKWLLDEIARRETDAERSLMHR